MVDFFISYNKADEAWAEWIGWVLEEAAFTVKLQKWDFRPGGNFVLEMQKAAATSDRTIATLSPDYLQSGFTAAEWAAAFASDPRGDYRKLVPVRVLECYVEGLLGPIIYIDLVGKGASEASAGLIAGLHLGRAKPSSAPPFPGAATRAAKPFPGTQDGRQPPSKSLLRIRRQPNDIDKRRFIKDGFADIARAFEHFLQEVEAESEGVQTQYERDGSSAFTAEVYIDGQLKANCRIWLGGMLGDNSISYAEGSATRLGNATNESLCLADGDELAFRALMDAGWGKAPEGIDTRKMSSDQASHYLWSRLVSPLT